MKNDRLNTAHVASRKKRIFYLVTTALSFVLSIIQH